MTHAYPPGVQHCHGSSPLCWCQPKMIVCPDGLLIVHTPSFITNQTERINRDLWDAFNKGRMRLDNIADSRSPIGDDDDE